MLLVPLLVLLAIYTRCAVVAIALIPSSARVTPAPGAELKKRGPGQTCGYYGGDVNSPLTCPGSSTCTTPGAYAFGCGYGFLTSVPSACFHEGLEPCGENCVYSETLSCTGALPSCVTIKLESAVDGSEALYSYTCGTASTTLTAYTTFDDAGSAAPSTTLSNNPAASTSMVTSLSNNPVASTSMVTSGSAEMSGSPSESPSMPTTASPPSSGSSNSGSNNGGGGGGLNEASEIGSIVGSVVGVLTLLLAVYGLYLKKKRGYVFTPHRHP